MKNVHVLSTDKPSRLISSGREFTLLNKPVVDKRCKNIYITSGETISVGDWVIEFQKNDDVGTVHFINSEYAIARDIQEKIVLTTDQDLIGSGVQFGVQEIEEDFLEWFENNPCGEVKVQKWSSLADCGYSYHITLPRAGAKQKTRKYSESEVLAMLLIKHDGLSPEYVLEQFKRNKQEAQS
jgi:hypothetical protein